jgi:hypothetical protein
MDLPFVSPLPAEIDALWERRGDLGPNDAAARALVVAAVDQLDAGKARVAWVDPASDTVLVDERAKRAILLSFKVLGMQESSAGDFRYHDRMPLKAKFDGVRVVPGAIVRWGAFVAPGAVLLPSFVNIGGYVDEGSMVDTWATVGSCAQVGKRVHLSGGVGLGGVLEPPNAVPVVVEDDAFIGSRSMVVDGARVRRLHPDGDHPRLRCSDGRRAASGRSACLVGVCRIEPAEILCWWRFRYAVPARAAQARRGRDARQAGPERRAARARGGRVVR